MRVHTLRLCLVAIGAVGIFCVAHGAILMEPGVDRPGQDLRPGFDLPAADPGLCIKACQEDAACQAFTYVKPGVQGPSARCWLKGGVPPAVKNDCCVSGVRAVAAPGATPAGLTPIQLPAPKTPPGNLPGSLPHQGGAGSDPAASYRSPMLLPPPGQTPQQATMPLTRGEMIAALVSSPMTKDDLEKIANRSRMSTMTLTTTTLSGAAVQAAVQAGAKSSPTFEELWAAPVTLRMTQGPSGFIADNHQYSVGSVQIAGAFFQHQGGLAESLKEGFVYMMPGSSLELLLDVPTDGGQYMVGVKAIYAWGKAANLVQDKENPGITAKIETATAQQKFVDMLSFVPTSANDGLVALWASQPYLQEQAQKTYYQRRTTMTLTVQFSTYASVSSVTITRL